MIDIDLTKLKNEIDKVKVIIDEYEEIQQNIFNQLKDSCINWQDGNSLVFEEKTYHEKQESELLLLSLKNKKEIYDFIYNSYSEIGKKIKCNLESKKNVLSSIENCISKTSIILNDFNKIDTSFYYYEKNDICKQKNCIKNIHRSLTNIKNSISKMYAEKIEKEILIKIQELDNIKVNDFDYELNWGDNNG